MGQLEDLRAFAHIVEQESIGKAAALSGVAKSAMSRRLRLLEARLQTALIVRTTRQWSLTEAGRQYYERGRQLLSAYDEFEADVRDDDQALSGDIRLSVPLYFGRLALTQPLLAFARMHPNVHLNVDFTDRLVDVVGEHWDLVVRVGHLDDSALIARPLCSIRHQLFASPAYLDACEPIRSPDDLRQHRVLQFGPAKRPRWRFKSATGQHTDVPVRAALNSYDGGFLLDAAVAGQGVARLPDFMLRDHLRDGRIREVLSDYLNAPMPVHLVYPIARYLPHRTRTLMDHLIAQLS
ncbi:MAG: LysR substrate-binding domain-containing protein [Pseudomonadota bacterium]